MMSKTGREIISGLQGLHDHMADAANIKRCRCRCGVCKREIQVNGSECLRQGWPECCGRTMTLVT